MENTNFEQALAQLTALTANIKFNDRPNSKHGQVIITHEASMTAEQYIAYIKEHPFPTITDNRFWRQRKPTELQTSAPDGLGEHWLRQSLKASVNILLEQAPTASPSEFIERLAKRTGGTVNKQRLQAVLRDIVREQR